MKTNPLIQLTKQYGVQEVERHLVYHFLNYNSILYKDSKLLCDYLQDFTPDVALLQSLQALNHNSIEEIAVDMELLIPSEDKKVNGAFFTPSYIADYILKSINPSSDAKIIDLSCGSGAFLLAITRYISRKYSKSIRLCIRENVYGADILEYNIVRCRLLLALLALNEGEIVTVDDMNLVCCDSLKHKWNQKFDAVVGNPPYVKFQDMDDETRLFLLENYDTTKSGTYNLYFAFFELGLKILGNNGKLGYITPNNYFTSLSGECLRNFFQRKQCIFRIVDFAATKVFDVQTYTAITFLNKEENRSIQYGRINKGVLPKQFLQSVDFTDNSYDDLSVSKWRLLCGDERTNIHNIENSGETIGNLFNICAGIATLKDEVYFVNPVKEDSSFFYIERNGVVFPIEKDITRPVVKISEVKNPEEIKSYSKYIIFPYSSENGKAQPIPEDVFSIKFPKCYEYFLSVKEVLNGRGKGKHIYTPFYAYGRTQGLNRTGIKLLTPTFSKAPRFLLDESCDGFFTNGYGVYLRERSNSLFDDDPIATPENLDVIQKILNSCVMEYYVEKTSVAIEGGYPCYQKNFIEKFTIPSFSTKEISQLRSLEKSQDINTFLIEKYHLNLSCPNRC